MSIILQSSSGGSVTLSEPTTASNFTQTLPAASGEVMVSGNQPAFSAYASATTSTTNITFTKVAINTEEFDTNNNFDSTTNYRFTPTIAGYYQVSGAITWATSATGYGIASVFKNGAEFKRGNSNPLSAAVNVTQNVSTLIYLNGSTDYIELYAYQNSGTTLATFNTSPYVYFQACLMRAA
jgi:hypothetical protein